mmetsp:Transcript_26873/g.58642  ORF Transcript_26873/g.58642 Transcript_26873/m.58642 type:complete len:429 (+) Transcript_26873:165-1451(+)|eukprot:CAMPEP_0202900620 /NCGR_PEP_ID=MMETSP1392-20130828/11939_1 /ASSEMBLY_ACC=CAM_ASM_000868 /TAXON_ID=225041 /ORGANISM="Chlamydomonas chlamydogama, Strain SAG 11-48b" /LENGTH=428 /DNA_ID=CAMNT_0049587043 /DNA_START=152 /DNA_END=1438 /DNA_ORIENTATION=+
METPAKGFADKFGASAAPSVWQNIPQAPPDPILSVTEAWKSDPDSRKLNLGVGAYRTEDGKPLVLNVVKKAEAALMADLTRNKEYLPITGNADFCRLSRQLAFGKDSSAIAQGRITTVQTLSGSGALRVGGEFLGVHYPVKIIYIPNPSWASHRNIFRLSGLEVREYRYFKPATKGLDIEGLLADLAAAPEGAVVLLHACAHNPTGVDPSLDQWRSILGVVQQRNLLPFFDSAYQGFASGDLDQDAAAVRLFAATPGMELLLAQSYAKNMGLYGERVGALSVLSRSAGVAQRVEGQLKLVIRPMYSSPPIHGAAIAARVLGDPVLFAEWKVELQGMADRIKAMRTELHRCMVERNAPGDWTFVLKQIGMFSYTGLNKAQCENMTKKWHVYMTMDGRISMAGLSGAKAPYLADAILDSLKTSAQPSPRL